MDNYQIPTGTPELADAARRWLLLNDAASILWVRRCELWDADADGCPEDIDIGAVLDVIEPLKARLAEQIRYYIYNMPEGWERDRLDREMYNGDMGTDWVMCQFASSFPDPYAPPED